MSGRLFAKQPAVGLLLVDLTERLRSIPSYQLSDNAFLASLVHHIVRAARPSNPNERAVMVILRKLARGFTMQKEGRRIVEELAAPCRKALPRKRRS